MTAIQTDNKIALHQVDMGGFTPLASWRVLGTVRVNHGEPVREDYLELFKTPSLIMVGVGSQS